MTYLPWFQGKALRQANGLPAEAIDTLMRLLARISDDPYDRLFSKPLADDNPRRRMADLDSFGFIEFLVDEEAGLIRIYRLAWTG